MNSIILNLQLLKATSKTTIAQDADNQKQLINQDTNSTTEEHDAANAKIDQAVAKANNDIDQAATNNDVDNAVATNQTEINQIQQDAQVKPAAKAEIAQKLLNKKRLYKQLEVQLLKKLMKTSSLTNS